MIDPARRITLFREKYGACMHKGGASGGSWWPELLSRVNTFYN